MKKCLASAPLRKVNKALTICDLFDGKDFAFDLVAAELDGDHPVVVNTVSDRVYYILSGSGEVRVGAETTPVTAEELVAIPRGTPHTIRGRLKYLIVTAPPFDTANERIVG